MHRHRAAQHDGAWPAGMLHGVQSTGPIMSPQCRGAELPPAFAEVALVLPGDLPYSEGRSARAHGQHGDWPRRAGAPRGKATLLGALKQFRCPRQQRRSALG
jgi:hypothetical protein